MSEQKQTMQQAGSQPAKIVFLDRSTLSPETKLASFGFPHEFVVYERTAAADTAALVRDADIVITNKVKITAEIVAAAPRLKLVVVAATGTDVIDLKACAARGVSVANIRDYAVNTVPEHTFALILALRRSIIAYRNSVRVGRWLEADQFCYFDHPIRDIAGSTLGIIGDGALGRAVADIARAFGMTTLFSAYKGSTGMGPLYTPFEELLRRSDIITLHCPLMPSTRDLIGAPEFAQMERRPLLINTARGGLVNEPALADALKAGQISGAGFDVVTTEPLQPDHVFQTLLDRPDFILTPHVAWASSEAIQGLADQLVETVNLFWQGRPRNLVTST
ncbi:MAG: glycerate dehydrogenase [Bradyrhizobium sp.]|nr:glycerate dehydrogenase [Bradyrhizobium sp.]